MFQIVKHSNQSYLTREIYYDYIQNIFYILHEGKRYNVENSLNSNTLYSLPTNNKQKEWSKKVLQSPIFKDENIVKQYWSKFRPGHLIRGYILNDTFIPK